MGEGERGSGRGGMGEERGGVGEGEWGTKRTKRRRNRRGFWRRGIKLVSYLLLMEVSSISMHLLLHFLGRPGICDGGIPFRSNVSTNMVSILQENKTLSHSRPPSLSYLSSLSMMRRAVTTFVGFSVTKRVAEFIIIHRLCPKFP